MGAKPLFQEHFDEVPEGESAIHHGVPKQYRWPLHADYAKEAATTHHALISTLRKNADNGNYHLVTAHRAQDLRSSTGR